ncbi:hypothetical protein THITH_01950 [Thioalkalivibrio paradoxus ARh 1]|uniref:Uncharacterized protein n=1 Tax=Thioalkalivibrio paradoxus ARh 1 TaxID=713585 RepID=W0DMP3_9GAMM|nr:hypothetical protein THITH_01950 [Thioalkalivibrio paradoxus ARh 1]
MTPEGIEFLIRQALPVLQALDSPDAPQLETLMPPRTALAQATGG